MEQVGPMLDVLVVTVLEEIEISLVAGCVGFHLRVGVTVGGSQGDQLVGLEIPRGLVSVPIISRNIKTSIGYIMNFQLVTFNKRY